MDIGEQRYLMVYSKLSLRVGSEDIARCVDTNRRQFKNAPYLIH